MQHHQSHHQILKNCENSFSFKTATLDDVENELQRLNINKTSHELKIPTKLLKEMLVFFLSFLYKLSGHVNIFIDFSSSSEITDVTPVYKKDLR